MEDFYDEYDELDIEDVDTGFDGEEFEEDLDFDNFDAEDQDVFIALSAIHMLETADMEGLDEDESFDLEDLEEMVENGDISEKYAHYIAEGARNVVKLTKESKLAALTRRAVAMLAKAAKDPVYTKYAMHRKKMKAYEMIMTKKYGGARAKTFARKMQQAAKRKKSKRSKGANKAIKHIGATMRSNNGLKGGRVGGTTKGQGSTRFNVRRG